ncbi:hypothetical protein [Psychrobacter aquimaris]|uniref:hypothetical protein n=1 Tax=Psychrobacter aquimaris TaxID=292733 RepID=UPI0018E04FC7|nr:hypothetical protein [Psychrobacter aquimaris]
MSRDFITQRRLNRQYDQAQAQFDALTPQEAADKMELDPISERMAITATSQMRLAALNVAFMLSAVLTDGEYDDEELLPSEVLDGLMIEAFTDDDDDDADLDEIDENVRITFSAHVSDALSTLGVEDAVIADLFDDEIEVADAACLAAAETVLENMPDDGEAFDDFVSGFAYSDDGGDEEDEESFDGMNEEYQFDAAKKKLRVGKKTVKKVNGKTLVYKAVKAIRNGKKVTINKRISGKVKLNASQRAGLKKARRKAGTSSAIRKQMRSFGKGLRANIYKGNPNRLQALKNAGYARNTKANFGK